MNQSMPLRWLLILLIALILIWRIVSVNLNQHAAQMTPADAASWQQKTSSLALQQAVTRAMSEPDIALQKTIQHAWHWPTDPAHWLLLGMLLEQQGQQRPATELMQIIHRLFPRQPDVQLQLGYFWARQAEIRRAMEHWGAALEMQGGLRQSLFPDVLAIAEIPDFHAAVNLAFERAGSWAEPFFMYAVTNAAHLDTLKVLYQARLQSKSPPTTSMQRSYLGRLIKQQAWTDAYFVWVNTLDPRVLGRLGNVFDGGFETDTPEQGFAWQYIRNEGVRVQAEPTIGVSGSRALHISFLGTHRITRPIATQQLLLDPGTYQLKGKFKVDNLAAVNGLSWEVHCQQQTGPIAKTPYFVDKSQWQNFVQPVVIPEGCEAPTLQLVLHAADARRNNLTGSIWFDDIALVFNLPKPGQT